MTKLNILGFLDLNRAKTIYYNSNELLDSESIILNEIKEKDFGIDLVYFNTDSKTKNSFPAIFLKQVDSFTCLKTLADIAKTHHKAWNYKKVLFLYVYSETEIRIYNCSEKPLVISKSGYDYSNKLKNIEISSYKYSDKEQLKELYKLFSRAAIDTGIIWTLEEAQFIRDKINLQRRVDKFLVNSLVSTSKQLEDEGLEINFIHKIILRSLFLLYLEDRGATDKNLYSIYKAGANSYLDILKDYDATYKLYERLDEDFNGSLFTIDKNKNSEITERISNKQLQIIRKCFISGNDNTPQTELFPDWRLFNFSIIQIELLSEIYEKFLFETDPELKKQTGTYYTPPSLVEFILNDKIPTNSGETDYQLKVLDPSCGSGIFLVESFKRLVKRHENQHKKKLNDFNQLKELLTSNIFGIELHPQAIRVAAFSLYLALVDCLDPKTLWQKKKHRLPYLINNPNDQSLKNQGKNLFCRDTIAINEEVESIEFDLVVGNPPFGGLISEDKDTGNKHKNIRQYCNDYKFAKEMVLPFLHKATMFAPNGEIALIFNTKVLTNTTKTYQNFRKWLFNECYVEKVYNFSILRNAKKSFGGQLFSEATGPISIVFYQKKEPKNPRNKITYYAPKTYIKSNLIEGLIIDATDVKYLPREECQNPETQIWKIAMWGGMNDWEFIEQLNNKVISIKSFLDQNDIDYGVGFEVSSPAKMYNDKIKHLPIHTSNNIFKYYTPKPENKIDKVKFRRLGKTDAYQSPHILLNEGIKVDNDKLSLLASYVDYKSAYTKGIVGIYSKKDDLFSLKLLTVYLNSEFIRYYSFLTTSSWGIERDVVKHKELFKAPYLLQLLDEKQKEHIVELYDNKLLNKDFLTIDKNIEHKINNLIMSELTTDNKYLIQHLLNNIELFHKQEKSVYLQPVNQSLINEYSGEINNYINDFLHGQELYANVTTYNINIFSPLMMIKLTFDNNKIDVVKSDEFIDQELKRIDELLWEKKSSNIYFRKKLNYKSENDVYIIRPNQKRFWSKSMALGDAHELIMEILNEN